MAPPYRKLMSQLSNGLHVPSSSDKRPTNNTSSSSAAAPLSMSQTMSLHPAQMMQQLQQQQQIAAAAAALSSSISTGAASNVARPSPGGMMRHNVPSMIPSMRGAIPGAVAGAAQQQQAGCVHGQAQNQEQQPQHAIFLPTHVIVGQTNEMKQQGQGMMMASSNPSMPTKAATAAKSKKAKPRYAVQLAMGGQQQGPVPASCITPPCFAGKKLRSGKWSRAEEVYAKRVIRDFTSGDLRDCRNGTTLRLYLAGKLHCSPMRISKKFAGANVGKAVFVAKQQPQAVLPFMSMSGAAPDSSAAASAAATDDNEPPLHSLEVAFYRSVEDESGSSSISSSLGPTPPPPSSAHPASFAAAAAANASIPPVNLQTFNQQQPPFQTGVPQGHNPPPPPPQYAPNQFMTPASNLQQGNPPAANQTYQMVSMQMQLVNQLQQQLASMQQQQATPGLQAGQDPEPTAASTTHQKVLHQNFLEALNAQRAPKSEKATRSSSESRSSSRATKEGHSKNTCIESTATSNEQEQVKDGPAINTDIEKSESTADIPEFLSGFEKISSAPTAAAQIDTLLGLGMPPTPTLTTKSFDELHRFLGEGIPSMPSFRLGEPNPGISSLIPPEGIQPATTLNEPATKALLEQKGGHANDDQVRNKNEGMVSKAAASNEYALLAQQSVIAVMQHSAYALFDEGMRKVPKANARTISEVNSSSSSTSESYAKPQTKRCRIELSPACPTASNSSYIERRRANIISGSERSFSEPGTESESLFGSSRGASSSGSRSDDVSNSDGSDDNGSSDQFDSSSVNGEVMKMSQFASEASQQSTAEVSSTGGEIGA